MTDGVPPRNDQFHFDIWSQLSLDTTEVVQDVDQMTRADGKPIYGPVDVRHPGWQRFTSWQDLGPYGRQLRGDMTKRVYLSPDGRHLWNVAGEWKGKEGCVLDEKTQGFMHLPFEQRYSRGAYMIGEELERTDYPKRVMHLGVIVGPAVTYLARRRFPDNGFAYRMLEDKWWGDWPENYRDPAGYWGEWTRTHGWRWIRVRLGEANEQVIERDPTAFGNNAQAWAMTIHGQFPFYSKRPWTKEWRNDDANAKINGRNHGTIPLANRAQWRHWPKYIVEGSGLVTIQDGLTDRMVALPKISPTQGMLLVDTDPAKRTLTSSTDPVSADFYDAIRNAEISDYILGDLTKSDSGVPANLRMPGGVGFTSQIPPGANPSIRVTHTNPRGKITAILPQWYKMAHA